MRWKALLFLAVCVSAAAAFPGLYGWAKTPPNALYLWSGAPWDNNGYLLLMHLGYDGAWLYDNLWTTEPHPRILSLPFYIALGHVARGYGWSWGRFSGNPIPVWKAIPPVYEIARAVVTLLLVFAIYGMTTLLTARRHRRLWIVAYCLFAAGTTGLGKDITGFTEGSVLASCSAYPHFTASLILYVGACSAMLLGLRLDESAHPTVRDPRFRAWAWVLAIASGLGLAWVHAFDLPPLFAVGAVVLLVRWRQARRIPRVTLTVYLAFCAVAGVSVLYQMSIMRRWEVFRLMDSNNVLYWWSRWASLKTMDGLLWLSVPGLAFLLLTRRRRPEAVFLVAWVVTAIVAMHAPVKYQRRLIEGLPIALACVLPWTVEGLLVRPLLRRGARPVNVRGRIRLVRHAAYALVLVALLPRTIAILYERSVGRFGAADDLYYVDMREVEAADWLARHAPAGSTVWASRRRGNRMPFLAGLRVFYGHQIMTVHPERKAFLTDCLFSFVLPLAEFRRIVEEHGIDYVFWTRADRTRGPFPDGDMETYDPKTLGKPVFDNGFAKIFAVRKD
ncbi:hypothetical protein JW916_02045 [Candidatus Sumerlaeota bacterium]|nr:hypothetical protein [Candidatus Sumerlaeota bacterium]